MRSSGQGRSGERVLSRHLADEHPLQQQQRQGGNNAPAELLSAKMGNLAQSLRRSMPAVNAQPAATSPSALSLSAHQFPIRHSSFSIEEERTRDRDQLLLMGDDEHNAIGSLAGSTTGAGTAAANRATSAHSCASLSPSGSFIFSPHTNASRGNGASTAQFSSRSVEMMGGGSSSVVDTRQIQVYLKNKMGRSALNELGLGDGESEAGGTEAADASQTAAAFPAPSVANALRSRKVFRSTDTRSSIFSVSSSLDSSKEERIISNLEHTSAASSRVVVLPRPHPLVPQYQSLQADHGTAGAGAMMQLLGIGDEEGGRKARASSAECRTPVPTDPVPTPTPPAAAPAHIPPLGLATWHSISDLSPSAREGQHQRRVSTQHSQAAGEASAGGVVPPELWSSPPPARPQSQASHRRSNYLGELVWQVDETVFCGGIEAVQNQNLLCRLNIEYIVDLSGQEDDPLLSSAIRPRTECPCLCPRRTAHSRMTMSIRVKDDTHQQLFNSRPSTVDTKAQLQEREEIVRYFETLIDLIRKARISQKKVLIHSLKGRNRAPAFVAAYLMHCNRVTRVQAINKITALMSSMRPGLCISDSLQRALMRWQSVLGIRAESGGRLDSQSLNKMFAVKKSAWN